VEKDPAFEVVAPTPLSVVCFRWRGPGLSAGEADRANEKILDAVNLSGEAYLSHTKLGGRTVLRLAIGNVRTEERHVQKAWDQIRNAVGEISK
jgi:aromatic-L-amino-acid decarboxylase